MSKASMKIRQLHRWIGLIFSISILMSAGSGVLHNVMSRTQPPPPQARPGGHGLDIAKIKAPVSEALMKFQKPDLEVQAISIRSIGGDPWYQIIAEGVVKPLYVSAVTGEVGTEEDEIYASQIAADYLGGKPVRKTDYLTGFNQEYINIFRILPVYRFDAEDGRGTRVYISTMTGSITRFTDKQKQLEANIFTNVHKLGFISNHDLRDLILTTTTGGVFLVAVLGIILFFMTEFRKK